MNTVMLTIHARGKRPTLELVRTHYGLADEEIDATFGIVEIDHEEGLFAILVIESAAAKVRGDSEWDVEGPFFNPRIEPFGPPLA